MDGWMDGRKDGVRWQWVDLIGRVKLLCANATELRRGKKDLGAWPT